MMMTVSITRKTEAKIAPIFHASRSCSPLVSKWTHKEKRREKEEAIKKGRDWT